MTSWLLALPAELRIAIFEFAVVEPLPIDVTATLQPPTLPLVCHQIRQESHNMWYTQNAFCFTIPNCDASLLMAFQNYRLRLGFRNMNARMRGVGDVPHQENLLRWCKYILEHGGIMIPKCDEADQDGSVIAGAQGIALDCRIRRRSWEECERLLQNLLFVAGMFDRRWQA